MKSVKLHIIFFHSLLNIFRYLFANTIIPAEKTIQHNQRSNWLYIANHNSYLYSILPHPLTFGFSFLHVIVYSHVHPFTCIHILSIYLFAKDQADSTSFLQLGKHKKQQEKRFTSFLITINRFCIFCSILDTPFFTYFCIRLHLHKINITNSLKVLPAQSRSQCLLVTEYMQVSFYSKTSSQQRKKKKLSTLIQVHLEL